jgi:ketosteroid isomerase-like protein
VQAIAEFYAPQASMQENMNAPRVGRDTLAAREAATMARANSVQSTWVQPVFVHGDQVVIRWVFEFEWKDGSKSRIEELAYQTWAQTDKGERIVRETFFYDPAQMRTTHSTNIAV